MREKVRKPRSRFILRNDDVLNCVLPVLATDVNHRSNHIFKQKRRQLAAANQISNEITPFLNLNQTNMNSHRNEI